MLNLLLLAASLLPPYEVRTFECWGNARYECGYGVQVTARDWQASGYVDGDYDVVTTFCHRGKVWHRTWTP